MLHGLKGSDFDNIFVSKQKHFYSWKIKLFDQIKYKVLGSIILAILGAFFVGLGIRDIQCGA